MHIGACRCFLYDDDDVDELVDQGTLSREYCAQCGCREIMPLTFISHSLSIDQVSSISNLKLRISLLYISIIR